MAEAPDARPAPYQPGEAIPADISCTQCGYNLRGLTLEGRCPEFGTPVERSIHGNLLRFADPGWLGKLRQGTILLLVSVLANFFIGLIAGGLFMAGVPAAVGTLLGLAGAALGLWGVILITTPEPALTYTHEPVTLRKVVRTCAVVQFVGTALQQGGLNTLGALAVAIGAPLLLIGLVAQFGVLIFLRRLAARMPDLQLAKRTTIVIWGYAASLGLGAIGGLIMAIAAFNQAGAAGPAPGPSLTGTAGTLGTGILCVAGPGMLIFSILYISVLARYATALRAAEQAAREPLPRAD